MLTFCQVLTGNGHVGNNGGGVLHLQFCVLSKVTVVLFTHIRWDFILIKVGYWNCLGHGASGRGNFKHCGGDVCSSAEIRRKSDYENTIHLWQYKGPVTRVPRIRIRNESRFLASVEMWFMSVLCFEWTFIIRWCALFVRVSFLLCQRHSFLIR